MIISQTLDPMAGVAISPAQRTHPEAFNTAQTPARARVKRNGTLTMGLLAAAGCTTVMLLFKMTFVLIQLCSVLYALDSRGGI